MNTNNSNNNPVVTFMDGEQEVGSIDLSVIGPRSEMIQGMVGVFNDMEDEDENEKIDFGSVKDDISYPIPDGVSHESVRHLMKYVNYRSKTPARETEKRVREDMDEWDRSFIEAIGSGVKVNNLATLASVLKESELHLLCCKRLAEMLEGKTAEEMKKILGMDKDTDTADTQKMDCSEE